MGLSRYHAVLSSQSAYPSQMSESQPAQISDPGLSDTDSGKAELPSASLFKRLAALLYDLFALFAVAFLYTAVIMAIASNLGMDQQHLIMEMTGENLVMRADENYQPALRGPLFQAGLFASLIGFYCFFWLRSGQTLGMQAWRIKLIGESGHSLTLARCLLRCVLASAGMLLLGLGYWWMLFDRERRTLHDRLSHTRVVQLPKPAKKSA